ncbi:hypothetical protein FGG08_001754 [Glutinoglossum americanum]|uniref:SPX domain-containing protein n=1 Tax=Glutinoglossum americanum TaxID=1670608 RepID=A0A9P8ICY8_9PEZI|nr:hypothetical protein FGG08_001754 [Glutinoglossum americanum]
MKFGHEFQEALRKDDFPQHWVKSAIAYSQLKKCVKRVQAELSSLGLDAQTLKQLLEAVEKSGSSTHVPFQYTFAGDENAFYPRLVFMIDANDGVPISARLSPGTKDYLENLALSQRNSQHQTLATQSQSSGDDKIPCSHSSSDGSSSIVEGTTESDSLSSGDSSSSAGVASLQGVTDGNGTQLVEIPLTSDSEFFHLLKSEVSSLDALQTQEEVLATKEVADLGKEVAIVAAPSTSVSQSDIYRWREIIELYTQAKVFFSTNERDHGSRNSTVAQKQFQWFLVELEKRNLLKQFKRKESAAVLNRFVQINMLLLRNLRFQEINRLAMTKILKKFDKRTALGAQSSFPELIATGPFLVHTIARAICFKVNEELLTVVPQLNDYLCPRANDRHCPMCRSDVVMKADSSMLNPPYVKPSANSDLNAANLDPALMNFLKQYFPKEVKIKQKENERAIMIDQFGPNASECVVM